MTSRLYPTPQDAEAAFYRAIERANLEEMMSVWAEDEEIICVHPGGEVLAGVEQVREGWRRIFASGQRLTMVISERGSTSGGMFAVRTVHEAITVAGDPAQQGLVAATNAYVRTPSGWRMVVHHASPVPGAPRAARPARPATLH